jgi:guanyl-specific ribonuclease Sa
MIHHCNKCIILAMKKLWRIACLIVLATVLSFAVCGCSVNVNITTPQSTSSASAATSTGERQAISQDSGNKTVPGSATRNLTVREDGQYSDKDSVARYIHEFGHLPSNYISKTKARKAGWVDEEGNLWDVLPGKSIGGSDFYNDEGQLPDAKGRRWTECDIDYQGGFRNAKRIVFSNDGLVFYTNDHYRTFEQMY